MVKIFGLSIFLVLLSISTLGSTQTDTLSNKEIKNRLNLALSNANDEPDVSLLIINEAIAQAERAKDKYYIHLAYITLGKYYLSRSLYDEALITLNQAYLNALETGIESQIHEAVTLLSHVHLAKDIKIESLEYLYKGLEISLQLRDSSSSSWFLIQIPEVEQEVGNISRAMEYALKAKSFFEVSNRELELGTTLLNLGIIHLKLGNLPLSKVNIDNAIEILLNHNDSLLLGKAKLALSKLHLMEHKLNQAEDNCLESMELLKPLYKREFYRAKSQLGEILISKRQYAESNIILLECLKYQQVIDDISGQSYTYLRLAQLHQVQKQIDKAIEAYRNSLLSSTNIGQNNLTRLGYLGLSQVMGSIGDFQSAYINLSHYTRITDSLFNIQKISEASKLEESYNIDLHTKEIQAKEIELNKRNDKITQQHQNQIVLYLISILFLGIAMFALREFFHKKKVNKTLALQKEELEVQKNIADRRTRDFTDSLNYAKRIQEAILRVSLKIKDLFPESFIILFPRNIVSGDFFWVKERNDRILFALADCTGHGVPGALMSIIGTYGLNRYSDEMDITSPSEMLYHLNTLFEESFKQKKGVEIFDGMDIALCSYNPKTKELIYAGANITLFILRESKQIEPSRTIAAKGETYTLYNVKPNKQPIGSYFEKKPFINHSINLMEHDIIYLFSDGFYDQFGGPDGRKYKSAQLYKLLCSLGDKSLASQKQILEETFLLWKGNRNQVDDVTLMGIKI